VDLNGAKHAIANLCEAVGLSTAPSVWIQGTRSLAQSLARNASNAATRVNLQGFWPCECVHTNCLARIVMTVAEYDAVRRFPTRFFVKDDSSSRARVTAVQFGRGASACYEDMSLGPY